MERAQKTRIKEKEVQLVADRFLVPKINIIPITDALNTTEGASQENQQDQPHTWRLSSVLGLVWIAAEDQDYWTDIW